MKEIKLTQGKVALVDDEDYERVSKYKWSISKYKYANNAKMGLMHRFIMNMKDSKYECDHIDRNTLNNQKNNLRYATRSENSKNRVCSGMVKYLGVSIQNCKVIETVNKIPTGKIHYNTYITAKIKSNGKVVRLGLFNTIEEAAMCYNLAAIKYHGEFANLNKIQ